MFGSEIESFMEQNTDVNHHFGGVYSWDNFPKFLRPRTVVIVNKAPSSQPGTHWIALSRRDNTYEVFDSLGSDFASVADMGLGGSDVIKYVEFNETRVQAEESESCGNFCIYMTSARILNFDLNFRGVMNRYFSADCEENERIVQIYVKHLSFAKQY